MWLRVLIIYNLCATELFMCIQVFISLADRARVRKQWTVCVGTHMYSRMVQILLFDSVGDFCVMTYKFG